MWHRLQGAVPQLLIVRRLRARLVLNEEFRSFEVSFVRMSRISLSVDPYGSTEDDSRRYRHAHDEPPDKSLERTAPRCVVDGVFCICSVLSFHSGADRCRRSALIR